MNKNESGGGAPEKTPEERCLHGDQLLWNTQQVCHLLGGINPRTLARLEKRGLIKSVALIRHKLYRRQDVERLVEEVTL